MGPGVAEVTGCGVEMWGYRDWPRGPQTMTSGPQISQIPEADSDAELRGNQQVRPSALEQGTNRLRVPFPVIKNIPTCQVSSYLYVSGSGGQARQLPGRRHCGAVGGGPCRPGPASSLSPRSAVASLGNEPGWGRYSNESETPPPAAAATHAHPEPGPKGGPDPGEETP